MSSYTAVPALHENIDQRAGAVHDWRVSQLARLGLAWPVPTPSPIGSAGMMSRR
jgi:hypothetical protein